MTYVFARATTPESIQRGRIKHSWLENEVLNKTPETVADLRCRKGWPELLNFPADASQALALADQVEFGFSPARLVDDCAPLARLADAERKAIRNAVHEAYLDQFDVEKSTRELRVAAEAMRSALNAMLEEWSRPDDVVSDAELQKRWRKVLTDAESLRDVLDALPKGTILP